ncbi:hypothetical protein [Companilactobacillus farciminis]|uniref:hypothetical protein n=1 Tax=Companilactobacillus farciminis TaxID=1612 RepID=UPI0024204552|nr:hypothetical protein [Companilactobacillus farciminis]
MSDNNKLRKDMNTRHNDVEKRGFTQSKHTSDFPASPFDKQQDKSDETKKD